MPLYCQSIYQYSSSDQVYLYCFAGGNRYQPCSEEVLLKAFEVLDEEKKNHLTSEELKKVLMEEGEPFSQEEMDEMLQAAVDPDKGTILYKDFVTLMLPEEEQT